MTTRADPSALAWLIGNELRQARERLGETQVAAAKVISCSTSRMNYLETGRTLQIPDDIRTLMRFYGAPDADGERLATLAANPDKRTWWTPWAPVIPESFRTFVGLEGFATVEFEYDPLVVPGLLQTWGYATALLADAVDVPAKHHGRVVEFRLTRQQRLLDECDPLRLTAVIEETTLDRLVGGAEVMREQLDHLLALSEQDNVSVQVMPQSVAVHDGLDGGFALLDFAATRPIAYVVAPGTALYIQDYHQVENYVVSSRRMSAAALPRDESREVIANRRTALP